MLVHLQKLELLELLAEREPDITVATETWVSTLRAPTSTLSKQARQPSSSSLQQPGFDGTRFVRIGSELSPLWMPLKDPAAKRRRLFGGMTPQEMKELRQQILADLKLEDSERPADDKKPSPAANFPSLEASYRIGSDAAAAAAGAVVAGTRRASTAGTSRLLSGAFTSRTTGGESMIQLLSTEYQGYMQKCEVTTRRLRRRSVADTRPALS